LVRRVVPSALLWVRLKIIQEVITISVFIVFANSLSQRKLAWNYLVAFAFLGVGAIFAFAFKTPGPVIWRRLERGDPSLSVGTLAQSVDGAECA
jgi:hypothetical protein